jgi:UDP-N-acetylglucosamine 2-epimerase (non-hydrolysing)
VAAGISKLIGTNSDRIIAEVRAALKEREQRKNCYIDNPYGDGQASNRILYALKCGTLPMENVPGQESLYVSR